MSKVQKLWEETQRSNSSIFPEIMGEGEKTRECTPVQQDALETPDKAGKCQKGNQMSLLKHKWCMHPYHCKASDCDCPDMASTMTVPDPMDPGLGEGALVDSNKGISNPCINHSQQSTISDWREEVLSHHQLTKCREAMTSTLHPSKSGSCDWE